MKVRDMFAVAALLRVKTRKRKNIHTAGKQPPYHSPQLFTKSAQIVRVHVVLFGAVLEDGHPGSEKVGVVYQEHAG